MIDNTEIGMKMEEAEGNLFEAQTFIDNMDKGYGCGLATTQEGWDMLKAQLPQVQLDKENALADIEKLNRDFVQNQVVAGDITQEMADKHFKGRDEQMVLNAARDATETVEVAQETPIEHSPMALPADKLIGALEVLREAGMVSKAQVISITAKIDKKYPKAPTQEELMALWAQHNGA